MSLKTPQNSPKSSSKCEQIDMPSNTIKHNDSEELQSNQQNEDLNLDDVLDSCLEELLAKQ